MRTYLVVIDDSPEAGIALRFAARRAARTGGGVAVLAIIPPQDFVAFGGVQATIEAEASKRKDVAAAAIDLRDQTASVARVDMLDYLRVTIPPIEVKAHEAAERIRVVYRDRPLPGQCVRPDGVQAELDAARARANAAARGL